MAENIVRKLIFGKPVKKILVVGAENRNASALMQYLLLHEPAATGMEIGSAGIAAREGGSMSERAVEYLRSRGIEVTGFRTKKLSNLMVENAELLLSTSMAIKGILLFSYPMSTIYTLSEYALMGTDVGDMGKLGDSDFMKIADELSDMAVRIAKRATKNATF